MKKDKTIIYSAKQLKRILLYFATAFGYKRPIFNLARLKASEVGKPLLNAGCGSQFTDLSDVNLDIVSKEVPNFVKGDIQNLFMFRDKQFGAVYASHVVEHVEDVDAAMRELNRVGKMSLLSLHFHCGLRLGFALITYGFFGEVKALLRHHTIMQKILSTIPSNY